MKNAEFRYKVQRNIATQWSDLHQGRIMRRRGYYNWTISPSQKIYPSHLGINPVLILVVWANSS